MATDADQIGRLLDDAIAAVNTGDLATAHGLAEQVLREDSRNREASELLATENASEGELRRLTILVCDLVGSTELSDRLEPERYRTLVNRYQRLTRDVIQDRYEGHIVSVKGDGFLSVFGYPHAHEDDTLRALRTGLDLIEGMRRLSNQTQRVVGESLDVRIGIHRGLVYVDVTEDDVYGLAANLAARVGALATPGSIVITDDVRHLVEDRFQLTELPAQTVKGVSEPVSLAAVVAERSGPHDRAFTAPFVGRGPELAALRSAWADAVTGGAPKPPTVLIRGEPGIGKSRLAQAITAEAVAFGAPVVTLAGSRLHTDTGLHPIRVLIEARCGIESAMSPSERLERLREGLRATVGDPDTTVPLLAPILGLSPDAGYDAVGAEGRRLEDTITSAAVSYLVRSFGTEPTVLLVEDLQWLDVSTRAILDRLAAEGPGTLFILSTSRPGSTVGAETVLELQPLSAEARLTLIEAMDTVGMSPAVRDALARRSDGIPLYVEELVRGWVPGSSTEQPNATMSVPDPLYEPLVARLLSTEAGIAVAGAAATMGSGVDRDVLAMLVDLEGSELDRELAALTTASILIPTDTRDGYRFRHELVREVAYELQPPAARRRMHERVADVLVQSAESDATIDWDIAATHYNQADRNEDASRAYARAADRARQRGALTEARVKLGRSIDLVAGLASSPERMSEEAALRLRRGFMAMSMDGVGSPEAARDFARCLELAMADARGDEMFSLLISLWAYHLSRAELSRTRDVLDVLRTQLHGQRERFRATNRAGYGMIDWFRGDFPHALNILEGVRSDPSIQIESSDVDRVWFVPNDPIASIHVHLGLARFMQGDPDGAEAAHAEAMAIADQLAFPQGAWSRSYGLWLRSWIAAEGGDLDAASSDAATVLTVASEHGFDAWSTIALTQMAAVDARRATPADAEDAIARATALSELIDLWEAIELLVLLPYYLTVAGGAFAAGGETARAAEHLDRADALARSSGMEFYAAETARQRAFLAPTDSAIVDQLRRALDLARQQGARPFELRIALDVHAHTGETTDLEAALLGFGPDTSTADLDLARAQLLTDR